MRRDSIFYKLFQQSPSLLFELLTNPPINAYTYRFDCVAVKEPKFEIDGVFLPPENASLGTVYLLLDFTSLADLQTWLEALGD